MRCRLAAHAPLPRHSIPGYRATPCRYHIADRRTTVPYHTILSHTGTMPHHIRAIPYCYTCTMSYHTRTIPYRPARSHTIPYNNHTIPSRARHKASYSMPGIHWYHNHPTPALFHTHTTPYQKQAPYQQIKSTAAPPISSRPISPARTCETGKICRAV